MNRDEQKDARTVVRMFAGYAGSPLWCAIGPVDLEAAGIDGELRAELEQWEQASYGTDGLLTGALQPGSEALADHVAAALGCDVEVHLTDEDAAKVFASPDPPLNPAAAEYLTALDAEQRRETAAARTGPFVAYAPLSGTVFVGGTEEEGPDVQTT